MQVKCPKCRFRFEATIPSGMTEVGCVCPRCGTPFAQLVPNEPADPQSPPPTDTIPAHLSAPHRNTDADHPSSQPTEPLTWQQTAQPKPSAAPSAPNKMPHSQPPFTETIGCLKWFLILSVAAITIILFGVRGCFQPSKSKHIHETSVATPTAEYSSADDNAPETEPIQVDPFEEIHPGEAPSWIQGTWTFATDYGDIKLTIQDKKITESVGDETVSGTFYYENRRLYCDFGDPDNITIYRLDMKRQQIDAGNGMLMTKEY